MGATGQFDWRSNRQGTHLDCGRLPGTGSATLCGFHGTDLDSTPPHWTLLRCNSAITRHDMHRGEHHAQARHGGTHVNNKIRAQSLSTPGPWRATPPLRPQTLRAVENTHHRLRCSTWRAAFHGTATPRGGATVGSGSAHRTRGRSLTCSSPTAQATAPREVERSRHITAHSQHRKTA
jgi:hypothetical protein